MERQQITRRDFIGAGTVAASGLAATGSASTNTGKPGVGTIRNHNSRMEYRRLGKTDLMVSAVCLGGHWKRVGTALNRSFEGEGYFKADLDNIKSADFLKNRHDVISHCIEVGINYVDACAGPEILAYSQVLKGRRDKMYLGYSWDTRESRLAAWRAGEKLTQGLDEGLREAKLDYVDVWRISLPQDSPRNLDEILAIESGAVQALETAKKQGKARFTGISTHNRVWLKSMIEQYPKQMEVVLFPYTAATKELPDDSVFDAIRKYDVGVFGIKPFASNELFLGDGSLSSRHVEEDDRRARLAIRYILNNPAITAPIPGMINIHQVDNVAKAVMERRQLDLKEMADLEKATRDMWAKLPDSYQWLKDWEFV